MEKINFKSWLETLMNVNLDNPKLSRSNRSVNNSFDDFDLNNYDSEELHSGIARWVKNSVFGQKIKQLIIEELFKKSPKTTSPESDQDEVWFDLIWQTSYLNLNSQVKEILIKSDIYQVFKKRKSQNWNLIDKHFDFLFRNIIHSFNYTLQHEAAFRGYLWVKENQEMVIRSMTLAVERSHKQHYSSKYYNNVQFNYTQMKKPKGNIVFAPGGVMGALVRFEVNYKIN